MGQIINLERRRESIIDKLNKELAAITAYLVELKRKLGDSWVNDEVAKTLIKRGVEIMMSIKRFSRK